MSVTVNDHVLVCAVRYALGRRTAAVSDVAEAVSANRERIAVDVLTVIWRDVVDARGTALASGAHTLGAATDDDTWVALIEALETTLVARHSERFDSLEQLRDWQQSQVALPHNGVTLDQARGLDRRR